MGRAGPSEDQSLIQRSSESDWLALDFEIDSKPWQASHLLCLDEPIELLKKHTRKLPIAKENACFDVPMLSPFGEIGRRDERQVIVHHDTLGVPSCALGARRRARRSSAPRATATSLKEAT